MRTRLYVLAFIVLVQLYVIFTFATPPNPETLARYDLTVSQARLLNLTVIVPLVLIWLTALYGFVNLKQYADRVAGTKEGKAFKFLSYGLLVLVFSLPINSFTSAIVRHVSSGNPDLQMPLTVIRNHLVLLFALTAFWILVVGARALAKTLVSKSFPYIPRGFTTGLIILAVIYTWLITAKPLNQGIDERSYYLPTGLLIFTLVIPYLLAWKAGLLTTYYLYSYHKKVKGVIFKGAFKDLAIGIGLVVVVVILIQLITTTAGQLTRLNLTPLLGIVYGLLIMYAVGFGLVARGAKKLKKIEDL